MVTSLQAIDFRSTTGDYAPGLVSVRSPRDVLPPAEEAAVRRAEAFADVDYVFLRRFADGRSSQVAAYVIDNGDERHDKEALARLHQKVWLSGNAPLLYIGWPTSVDVLSCARGPDFWRHNSHVYEPVASIPTLTEQMVIAAEVSSALEQRKRFSALRLSNGTFWDDQRNSDLAHAQKTAHHILIQAVVDADKAIKGEQRPALRRLLLLTVLIKYLEDRKVFPKGWFDQFHQGAGTFFEVLQQGTPDEVRDLLGRLERKFNGDVFSLPEEARALTSKDLKQFADLVGAKTLRDQQYLWELYSFRHIPVEVISHLYQRFTPKGRGAVYTPAFVTSLLLDYAMPYQGLCGHERVLDPTCGSGIFLVGAFRRLVNHWRSQHEWQPPDVPTLKGILKRSIFGVELHDESLHLASFSLALAVCDALMPDVIWDQLRFDPLHGTNLIEGDFFDFIGTKPQPFDVVLGNPPFMSELTDAATRVNTQAAKIRGPLPDSQIAYLIYEQASKLLSDRGRLCLIQPSGLLYNEKSRGFQQLLLGTQATDYVLDFTSIRGLFGSAADPKVVALVARNAVPDENHRIAHLTFRRTFSVEEQIGFELDHYDRHIVPQQRVMESPFVWKVNLLGGGRLYDLVCRLKSMGTLKAFFAEHGWDMGEGFIVGNRQTSQPWLTGLPYLPSVALTDRGISQNQIGEVKEKRFEASRDEIRYSPPLVLIRENEKLPCAFWDDGMLAYRAQIVGIHAPNSQRKALRQFFDEFQTNRSALRAFCMLIGTRGFATKATAINKTDIDNIPWPGSGNSWDLSPWEKTLCDDLLDHMADYIRLGQNSKLLREQVTRQHLKQYADCFVDMLGSLYGNLHEGQHSVADGFVCQTFFFGDKLELDWPEDWTEKLHQLVYVQHGETMRTVRVLRFYDRNAILIVKPDRLRYWIRSTAIRDADETLVDLRGQGY